MDYIFDADSMGQAAITLKYPPPRKATEFGKIMQNIGHVYAVQDHSRSFWYQSKAHVRFPISSELLTYILSRTVSKLLQILGQFSLLMGVPLINIFVRGELLNSRKRNLASRK